MSGFKHFLLSLCTIGFMVCSSRAWWVDMPRSIKALWGSCVVIPCSYDYYRYPPVRHRVVWYKYQTHGYPLVYDNLYPLDVTGEFRGRTSLHNPTYKSCSLKIYPVTNLHDGLRIYPWVDPENIGKSIHRFFDKTVRIDLVAHGQRPRITFSGSMKIGQTVQVECSVDHTCPAIPPNLNINIKVQSQSMTHSSMSDGTVRTTLKSTYIIERDHQTVECTVRYPDGESFRTSASLDAQCSISPLTISPTSYEFLEGQTRAVTCTASYTCSQHKPTLTWNYGNMPTSTVTEQSTNTQRTTVSTLSFTASANDHGRSLTCYASGGQTQDKSITLQVKRSMLPRGWSFTTPPIITGMKGSCVIIPCKFTYTTSLPADLRVIWYLYQSNEYPPVFDQTQTVVSKFRGLTSSIGSVSEGNCSLKIEKLDMSHNQDRLYPWIDKNSIHSYHTTGYQLYDKTTQLIVSEHAQEPKLSTTGIPRVGEQSKVSCSVRHTCISAPPTLTLSGKPGTDLITDTLDSDWIWERTVERTWTVEEDNDDVNCTVQYPGGQRATKELILNAECPYQEITMVDPPAEATEGVAKFVICSVSCKCKKNEPTIVWNFENMQSSSHTKKLSSSTYQTVSNLTFIGSLGDDGKFLNCTAKFMTGETSDSTTLHIEKYEPDDSIYPHDPNTYHIVDGAVPVRFTALTRSCVVIPCSFQYHEDVAFTRGVWSKRTGGIMYHNGQSMVHEHFKGRTRLIGDLNEGNCSVEIDDIKPFDNGPFCFHLNRDNDRYKFTKSCVFVVMKASPDKPVMTQVPAEADAGSTISVSCSVPHTCQSHPPDFSWSVPSLTNEVTHTSSTEGIWNTTSTITFMVPGGDGDRNLTCTATFWRGKQQATIVKMNVKGTLRHQFISSLPVSIPVSLLVLGVIISGSVFGVFIWRRRKHTDNSPPPRPEKRRSIWERLSRRHPEDRERPPRPEKRRSIWSRFSRRHGDDYSTPPPRPEKRRSIWDRLSRRYPEDRQRPPRPEKRRSIWDRFSSRGDERVAWKNERKPRNQGNNTNLNMGYLNNTTSTVNCDSAKPRFPSPKDNRRRPPGVSSAVDYQLYGNL